MVGKFTLKDIKEALVKSIIAFNPDYFKPFLFDDKVQCDATSKNAFYKLFKMMVCSAKAESVGKLKLTIEETDDPRKKLYCFYDEVHLHSRLNIDVIENEDSIWIEILPF